MQAKRVAAQAALANRRVTRVTTAAVAAGAAPVVAPVRAQVVQLDTVAAAAAERKRSGFLAQFFGRIFKKSA